MIQCLTTLVFLSLFATQSSAASLRGGGGIIIDKSIWGGGLALDFNSEGLPLAVSVFADHYRSSLFLTSFYAVNLLARAEVGEGKTQIFIGGGVGGMRVREKLYSITRQSLVFNLAARIRLQMTTRTGFFGEIRHNFISQNSVVDLTGLCGISINLGK
jgi:hypothetical protein